MFQAYATSRKKCSQPQHRVHAHAEPAVQSFEQFVAKNKAAIKTAMGV